MKTPVCCRCGALATLTADAKHYCARCAPNDSRVLILPQPAALTRLLAFLGLAVVAEPLMVSRAVQRRRELARKSATEVLLRGGR